MLGVARAPIDAQVPAARGARAHLVRHARRADCNRRLPRVVRDAYESSALRVDAPDGKSLGEVAVVPAIVARHVDVDNVALVQHVVVRDAVAHNLCERTRDAARVSGRARAVCTRRAARAHR